MPNTRQCGECTVCCRVLPVIELNKPRYIPCEHLSCAGCGIYRDPKKPAICREFLCEWLVGNVPEQHRPDRLGVMLWFGGSEGRTKVLRVSEVRAGALTANERGLEAMVRRIIQRRYKRHRFSIEPLYVPYHLPGTGLLDDGYEDHLVRRGGKLWLEKRPEHDPGTTICQPEEAHNDEPRIRNARDRR